MQTLAIPGPSKSFSTPVPGKSQGKPFFSPLKVQTKLTVGAIDDPYEREADAMADRVMRMPASEKQTTFFKSASSIIQRQDDATKTLTEGAGVVKDQLDDKPGFEEWKDKQTDALKKKVWDDQPMELKAGIIGYGLSSLGILGTVFGTNPGFRADTIKLLNEKNIAMPLSLIPYHEYFPLSSFKYKLPSAQGATTEFSTEFEFKPYLDLMHQKWSFIPKTDITLGVDTAYSKPGGFGFSGGSIKIKFGGGIINLQGFLNQTLPATPMLVSGNNPGESPMWIMRTLPGQFEDQLLKGSGIFLSVDVLRLPELWKGDDKKTDVQRKVAVNEEDNLQRKESGTNESVDTSLVEHAMQSPGNPLDKGTKSFMEDRFGYDFSGVKIHTGSVAAKSAGSINALAYTSGNNIVFNQNQYSPGTDSGKRLLAHELTHVVQQGSNLPSVIQKEDDGTRPRGGTSVHFPVVDELLTQVSDVHSMFAGRELLPAESTLARTVFGNSVDYSRVRLILGDLAAGTTAGNNIRLPRNFDIRNDEHKQLLIHEMTHAWQFQHNGAGYITTSLLQQAHASRTRGNRNFAYDYRISAGNSFFEFAPEQQAFMVENYYAMLRDQQSLSTPEGTAAAYKSNHLDTRGFNASLNAAQRSAEIDAELPLHEPLIRQMSSTPFLSPASLLLVRQRDVMIMPPGGNALPPASRDQSFAPTPNLFEVRFNLL